MPGDEIIGYEPSWEFGRYHSRPVYDTVMLDERAVIVAANKRRILRRWLVQRGVPAESVLPSSLDVLQRLARIIHGSRSGAN